MNSFMSRRGAMWHRLRPMIRKLLVLLLSVSLAACETSHVDEPGISPEQRALYQLVRDAQAAAEKFSKPGMSSLAASDSSFEVRARGLAALGYIESADAMMDPPSATSRAPTR